MFSWFSKTFGFENEDLKAKEGGEREDAQELTNDSEAKQGLWSLLSSMMGKDITKGLSLPVWVFEPTSFLQVMAEPMQYFHFLAEAAENDDPSYRMALLATFLVAQWSCSVRTKKPFNPLLGETFEMLPDDKSWRYLAEQVSHHPPIGVAHITHKSGMTMCLENHVTTKFTGNSVEAYTLGTHHLYIPKYEDHYSWGGLTTKCHNIFIGKMWLEHVGTINITNHANGFTCELTFQESGLFGGGCYEINATIKNKEGVVQSHLKGLWSEKVDLLGSQGGNPVGEPKCMFTNPKEVLSGHKYRFSSWVKKMTELDTQLQAILVPTDSRLRGDRRALDLNKEKLAGDEKDRLEVGQRARRKEREEAQARHKPKYFRLVNDPKYGERWVYAGGYWEEREKRVKAAEERLGGCFEKFSLSSDGESLSNEFAKEVERAIELTEGATNETAQSVIWYEPKLDFRGPHFTKVQESMEEKYMKEVEQAAPAAANDAGDAAVPAPQ